MAQQTKSREKAPHITAKNVTKDEERFLTQHADQLSRTTLRAKWIHSPDEHEDRPGQSLATRSHDVIKRWAEERQAEPATVPGTEHDSRPGVLRFDFPGYGGRTLQKISWDVWFKSFDERQLVFVFQEHKRDGQQSNFFQLDNPQREEG
jgi:hypothetical protein